MSELLITALADAAVQLLALLLRRILILLRHILCPKLKELERTDRNSDRISDEDLFE